MIALRRQRRGGQAPSSHAPRWPIQALSSSVQSLIVNLPARLDNEQENANAGQSYYGERDEKCFHDLRSKKYLKA
jgi:hypothetical protein